MSDKTKQMLIDWLALHFGDKEALAQWMSKRLKLCGIKKCRAMIAEAVQS